MKIRVRTEAQIISNPPMYTEYVKVECESEYGQCFIVFPSYGVYDLVKLAKRINENEFPK